MAKVLPLNLVFEVPNLQTGKVPESSTCVVYGLTGLKHAERSPRKVKKSAKPR